MERTSSVIAMVVCVVAVTGCDDAGQRPVREPAATAVPDAPANASQWLSLKDDTDPSVWLIGRAAAKGRPLDAQEAAELPLLLKRAEPHFKESQRMIANRAAQISDMLHDLNGQESVAQLIGAFLTVGTPGRIEGFGAVGQHYVNLRKSGQSKETAIENLRQYYAHGR